MVELDGKDLFLGLAMVLHSTGTNIEAGNITYEDTKDIYTKVLPEIAAMILEQHSDEEMAEAAKKMGGLLNEIAKEKGVSIS